MGTTRRHGYDACFASNAAPFVETADYLQAGQAAGGAMPARIGITGTWICAVRGEKVGGVLAQTHDRPAPSK